MGIKEFLEFKLISLENYSLTVSNIVIVIVIIGVTYGLLYFINKIFKRHWKYNDWETGRSHSLFLLIRYISWTIALVLCVSTLGINTNFFLAGSAAIFVGLGFGLQSFFNDLISGIILLFDGAIKVDDVIEVDGIVGKVIKMNLRATSIMNRDDIFMIIPNHKFFAEKVINWSHGQEKTRFTLDVGVAYGSDTRLVEQTLLEAAKAHPDVLKAPDPRVRFDNFGDSSLDFKLQFYSENSFGIERVKSDIRFEIDQKFREKSIEIPFPQRDMNIKGGNLEITE